MSFTNSTKCENMPGPLNQNQLGCVEKVSITTKKVFDACIKQETLSGVNIVVTNITPAGLVNPLSFVSAKNLYPSAPVSDLKVIPLADSDLSRVACNVVIPLEVVVEDAHGTKGIGVANLVIPKDVVLCVPTASILSYEIEAISSVVCPEGQLVTGTTFAVSACVTIVIRVVMDVQLLIPTYGYGFIPPCQEYTEEICDGIFDLPLYPTTCKDKANKVGCGQ